jgi:YHS domain-containing protein
MTVDPAKAKNRAEHAGHSYFFCSARCLGKFPRLLPAFRCGRPGSWLKQTT